jgi:excisionase family DNA binding protein
VSIRDEKIERLNGIGIELSTENKLIFENRIANEWLTTEVAAQYLGISSNALRIMVHRDQIRSYKFGRRLRFRAEDCRALFTSRGVI